MKNFLAIFLLAPFLGSLLQAQQLSDKAEIVVMTLGPDENELYAAFGHSAFRVIDPDSNIDRVYNYGIFDYNQPNFYLNFAKGYLNYKLDTTSYPKFKYAYQYYNRFIHEQVLNLSQIQKQKIFDYLEWNMLPENQYYYYDYFYDNCATRIRDVLVTTLGNDLQFDGTYITTDYTIRELTDIYLHAIPWGDLGIDLCLGLPMDKMATSYMYMFLPDYIEIAFDHATLINDSTTLPLVKSTVYTFEPVPTTASANFFTPSFVLYSLLVLIILISIYDFKQQKLSKWLDILLFGIIGLIGLLLLLLWTVTDHQAAAGNMNLLWAMPTHLIAVILLFKRQPPVWFKNYFLIVILISTLLLISWAWLPQLMLTSLIPLIIGLGIRSWMWVIFLKNPYPKFSQL